MMTVPPKYDTPHLWIVIAHPTVENPSILAVNVTSDKIRAGNEFVFRTGDHPRITKECRVSFSDALIIPLSSLKRLTGILVTQDKPMNNDLVSEIIEIAKKSSSLSDEKKGRL